jgi:class 3 adenylate cyclase
MDSFSHDLQKIYNHFYENNYMFHRKLEKSARTFTNDFSSSVIVPEYSFQKLIRPLYGKINTKESAIGTHPDFKYLEDSDQHETWPIVTFFMDIENSTRLNLLYDLEHVTRIKNAFICAAIEIINSFDGHVHRIMGDAVMAFFGGKRQRQFNTIIDALNCSTVLLYFVKEVIIPGLEQYGDQFGIRIGMDYGEDVFWSFYGYPGGGEVTATSFYVDVASKLQHQAGRNNIMVGNKLREHIDFPMELLDKKYRKENDISIPEEFLIPNMTDRNGKTINYRKYLLKWEKYLEFSPIPYRKDELLFNKNYKILSTRITIHSDKKGNYENDYYPSSSSVPKTKWIKFLVTLPKDVPFPYSIKFSVENHGREAEETNRNKENRNGNHDTEYNELEIKELSKLEAYERVHHWEEAQYKGFHYMKIELIKDGSIKYLSKYGIYVE